MDKRSLLVLPFVLGAALAGAQVLEPVSGAAQPNTKDAFVRSPLACTEPGTIKVPYAIAERAKLKARLLNLLRESLYDDAAGVVNIAREKEIRKLANKLRAERQD